MSRGLLKLTPEAVKNIRKLRSEGAPLEKLAKTYKVATSTIVHHTRDIEVEPPKWVKELNKVEAKDATD